jgi:uncharacterized protein
MHVPYGNPADRSGEIETVRAIYDAFARRDVEGALAHISEDVDFMPSGTISLVGRSEPYRGHDGVRQYFADAAAVWEDLRLYAEDFRAAAGGVVVFGRVEGVADGKPFRARAIWIWQVRGGRAASMRVNPLGADPPG